jgi:hypothetical protein
MFAPVVAEECIEVDAWCLLCLYIFAEAAKGEPASPAITSAATVSLLFIIMWNSSLDHTGGNGCWPVQFHEHCECRVICNVVRPAAFGTMHLIRNCRRHVSRKEGVFAWT